MKLAVLFDVKKWWIPLFTGCTAYHVGWVDPQTDYFYDMHLIRRRRYWSVYSTGKEVMLFDVPHVTREYLEKMLTYDKNTYGFVDYCLFALRPFYHLFGKSTRNAKGVICSEMVNNDIWACGGETPWHPSEAPPSPCDLYRWLTGRTQSFQFA